MKGPTNPLLKALIEELNKQNALIWKRIAYELGRPKRKKRQVNLSELQRNTKSGETVLLLGKLLSSGTLKNKLIIATWNASTKAAAAVKAAGGTIIPIQELIKKNPKGTGVKVVG